MLDTQAVKYAFGKAATTYDAHAGLQKQVRGYALKLAEERWERNAYILDAGSGTGALLNDIEALSKEWQVTDLDLSYGMCVYAHKRNSRVVNAYAEAMPFADQSFDGVFSSLMLQWVNNSLNVWREMRRVVKSNGSCIIATFTQGTLHELRESFAAIDSDPHVSHFLPKHDILLPAVHAGFAVPLVEEVTITQHYSDAISLMRSLKTIGASNKESQRRKGLMTAKYLANVERVYKERFGSRKGLPATWKILYVLAEKIGN